MYPPKVNNLRCFIPAKDYNYSRRFYKKLGFEETFYSPSLAVFQVSDFDFYLQNFYAKELAENYMVLLHVESPEEWWLHLQSLDLPKEFPEVKMRGPRKQDYGWDVHLLDPSGVLWHFTQFK